MSTKKREETTGELTIKTLVQEKNGKVIIEFTDGKKVKISEDAYLSMFLYPGKTLTKTGFDSLVKTTDEKIGRDYINLLLSRRLYSPKELQNKLIDVKKMSYVDSSLLIQKMVTEGYIDFSLYAQDRVESLKLKGFSREYIYKDLKNNRLDLAIIDNTLGKIEIDDEAIIRILNDEIRKHSSDSYVKLKDRLKYLLYTKGYDEGQSESLLSKLMMENGYFSSDFRQKDALRKAVLSSYDKIKRLKIEPRKKEQKLYRSLLYKGFSRDEILDVIKEEDLYFD